MKKKLLIIELVVLGLAAAAAIPLRIYELFHLVDPSTGFFTVKSPVETALNIVLLLCCVLAVPFYFVPGVERPEGPSKNVAGAVVETVLAACFFIAFLWDFGSMMVSANASLFVIALTEALTAVYFGMAAARGFTGKTIPLAVPALFPVAWGVVVLVISYMHYTGIVNISEYLYDVLKMVAVLIFFYYDSLAVAGVKIKKSGNGRIAFGIPAAVFCLATSVSDIVAALAGKGNGLTVNDFLYFVTAVYILFSISQVVRSNFRNKDGVDATFEWQANRA